MVFPSGVDVHSDLIKECSDYNIPLFVSHIEHNTFSPTFMRVTSPNFLNACEVDFSRHYFSEITPCILHKVRQEFERRVFTVSHVPNHFDFMAAAQEFEISYLIPNLDPTFGDCDDNQ
ncbi:hypothetical protein FUA23_18320 [Neolewinella aurantiaca]|uniref:Uncharacterized protein n=1 Tax=Neolewinella aurantiaca TaxID=2602767 RepID=A0A5C7FQA1_9BACT|nr:hypothetical protein [Neolewinella aurantiaca]TXF87546.1 hypothetical protein FUA23_18320 [Neolewinella aurantiaca]